VLQVESGLLDRNNRQDIPLDTQAKMPVFRTVKAAISALRRPPLWGIFEVYRFL